MSYNDSTIFLPSQPLQTVANSYGTVSTTVTGTAIGGLIPSINGIPIVSDPYVPAGEMYLIPNGNMLFKYNRMPSGNFGFEAAEQYDVSGSIRSYGELGRKEANRSREIPEPEIQQFERSISFDD